MEVHECLLYHSQCTPVLFVVQVLGVIRCPVYVWREELGLPAFLLHNFVGNARHQLLYALEHEKILNSEDIKSALEQSERLKEKKEKGEV